MTQTHPRRTTPRVAALPSDPTADPASAVGRAAQVRPDRADLLAAYFDHVPAEDQPRTADDVLAIVDAHWRVGHRRQPGETALRVFNPRTTSSGDGTGWSDTTTVIDIVNDDMPYLVESVIGVLSVHGVAVHRVLHPILTVIRDDEGELSDVVRTTSAGAVRFPERAVPEPAGHPVRESWMHVLVDRLSDAERAEAIEAALLDALADVRAVVADAAALTGAAAAAAAELRATVSPRSAQEVSEAADFLYWLVSGNLTFLGYRRYERLAATTDGTVGDATDLHIVPGSGLGVLRGSAHTSWDAELWAPGEQSHLLITRSSAPSALTRDVPPFEVRVRLLDSAGAVTGEHRFLGALTPRALNAEITTTPVLRLTVQAVLSALGSAPDSYTGQRAMDLLATYPRAELFWASPDLVVEVVGSVLQLASRRRLRAFLQPDPFSRFVSVMVYLPRDRYTTKCRLAMQRILLDAFDGTDIQYTARVGDSLLAAVHFTVLTDPARRREPDPAELTRQLRATIRSWEDRLVKAVVGTGAGGADPEVDAPDAEEHLDTAGALARYADAFDEAYKQDYTAEDAVADLRLLDQLNSDDDLALRMIAARPAGVGDPAADQDEGDWRLKLYVNGGAVTLSRALPVLQSLGAEVIDERPFEVRRGPGTTSRIYDFGLRFPSAAAATGAGSAQLRTRLTEAFAAAWSGRSEVDGFNELVLAAGMDWTEVAVLRAYVHYLRQVGTPYTQAYVERVLVAHPAIAAELAALFRAQFDPELYPGTGGPEQRATQVAGHVDTITRALDEVTSLDADRILRSLLRVIQATRRTNRYRRDDQGRSREFLSFKIDPGDVPGMPKPIPAHEIWVYSPRVEGVHLRFGDVARGGLRWSDRPEDFRTEVLGLVKAQEVKNAVIVPVGAKGGFVVRRPPAITGDPAADRERLTAEGIACYRMFIAGLLDLTDNRVDGAVVPPPGVVRRDGDDPYLVVAADKGTATFSDIANAVAAEYGFWLGDGFASGGSVGYDHKAMGITARGAWESVKHHFRELGVDTQTEDFTCVGVGDMSGDVFGNGMLLSQHIRLVGAFDHRHIFVDPDPDAGPSFVERLRLFELPRSSWADYDTSLISAGGGVWPRTAKSIPISAPMRAALGLADDVSSLAPPELMRAILLAPVDLLWNGGIGTYVKASTQANSEVGDKANDPVRVDGADLRAKVVGEGGNLGVTQLGRIEFARAGGRINTDAIDNSAGVDTSDHEVNIKIALQMRADRGDLDEQGRRELLSSMTDEVAHLVLADNIGQNRVLGVARSHAAPMLSVHARLISALVESGRLDRALEFLPSHTQINQRLANDEGLTSPELSVLLAYVKSGLSAAMIDSDLPSDPAYSGRLLQYFPHQMQDVNNDGLVDEQDARDILEHPLARQIITTQTVNEMVNRAGTTYAFRLEEELSAPPVDAIRAYTITCEVFDLPDVWASVAALDHQVSASCQDTLTLWYRRLLDRSARWLLTRRPQPLDVRSEIDRYAGPVAELLPLLPGLLRGPEARTVEQDTERVRGLGAPEPIARRMALSLFAFGLLDIVDVAHDTGRPATECAELYYALSAHLEFEWLLTSVSGLPRGDRWGALARQALRDDLYRSLRLLTADVLSTTSPEQSADDKIRQWETENASRIGRAGRTLGELTRSAAGDLAGLSVAAREMRSLIR
ncbi:NAD-glutamate dehydrogenase [Nakamurella flava]|uniref:NAD-glutamate dehydrogenase n=1 Tax=Nakamurella flava TaxID=2576308 RepID=A0A4V6CSE5_9ACTN|nr:NAD-glutamate dehydrogenase [Nakamurella flava]TKV61255.1 NAD-glutamate dehydrogenase [Nakamurella flava]